MTLQLVTADLPQATSEIEAKRRRALEVIDSLRADVASGKLKAFTCVGIASDHTTFMYQASIEMTTKLELWGASACLQKTISDE